MEDKIRLMRNKFKKAHYECDYLEDKIDKQDGILIKVHRYTIEELLNGKHYKKINAITKKIGSDVELWELNGNFEDFEKEAYFNEREEIDDKLHEITRKINNREPTWWEEIKGSAEKWISYIMNNLPEEFDKLLLIIMKKLLEIPYLGKAIKPIFYLKSKSKLLLSH